MWFEFEGRRHEFDAANHGDWYDTGTLFPALEAAITEARPDWRIGHLEGTGQDARFVIGPGDLIEELEQRFGIVFASNETAESADDGLSEEDRLLRAIFGG